MRRTLVLTDESASHPFLRLLPPHVRHGPPAESGETDRWRISRDDVRGFATVYFAVFAAALVFIA